MSTTVDTASETQSFQSEPREEDSLPVGFATFRGEIFSACAASSPASDPRVWACPTGPENTQPQATKTRRHAKSVNDRKPLPGRIVLSMNRPLVLVVVLVLGR